MLRSRKLTRCDAYVEVVYLSDNVITVSEFVGKFYIQRAVCLVLMTLSECLKFGQQHMAL